MAVVPEQFPRSEDEFAGIFTRDYVEAIRASAEVVVVLVQPGAHWRATARREQSDGVEYVVCTPMIRGTRWQRLARIEGLYRLRRVASLLGRVDLVHAHGAIFHGAPAVALGRQLGAPVVLSIHTGPFTKLLRRKTTRLVARRTLESVDCVCAVSNDLADQIRASGIRPKRVEVTYNPVDTELFRRADSGQIHHKILFAGRLEEYKGALRVVEAFQMIADRLSGWSLTVAGAGPERAAIEAFVETSRTLAGRVELVGSFTRPELAELLRASDFFVYPSRHETFGLVLAEAMAAGLPVIAPDRTAPPEFVDERSGVLVPPDDVDAIAEAMERVVVNLARFDRAAIRQTIVERFGIEAFGRRLNKLYWSVLESHASNAPRSCVG